MGSEQKNISYRKHLRLLGEEWNKSQDFTRTRARRKVLNELRNGTAARAQELLHLYEDLLGDCSG